MSGHTCHARGCKKAVAPELLMCGPHWRAVPKRLQLDVWRHYRPGQCDDKQPSQAWLDAAQAAIEHVARADGWTPRAAPAPAQAAEGPVPSHRATTSSRHPGQTFEGTVQVQRRSPIDWEKEPPSCRHGVRAETCRGCQETICCHQGAAVHECASCGTCGRPWDDHDPGADCPPIR